MRLGMREVGCLVDRGSDREEVVSLGGYQELQNAGGYAGGDEVHPVVLAAHEMPDDQAKAAGVHVGDFSEVEDVDLWRVQAWSGFEDIAQCEGSEGGIHVACRERSGETEDNRIGRRTLLALDGESSALPDLSLHAAHSLPLRRPAPRSDPRIVTVLGRERQGQSSGLQTRFKRNGVTDVTYLA